MLRIVLDDSRRRIGSVQKHERGFIAVAGVALRYTWLRNPAGGIYFCDEDDAGRAVRKAAADRN